MRKGLFKEFLDSEKAGGLILVFVTLLSLVLANSSLQNSYLGLWQLPVAGHPLVHWINDGLMTIFFLLIGLELEREIYSGQLSSLKNASLPFFGALGGMIVPAGIFSLFNYGRPTQGGAGIPMATDIAFAIGILSLLGNRVLLSLKVFLTALAVIDDLGAILIIAVFYAGSISGTWLLLALGIFGVLLLLNRFKVHHLILYLLGGVAMWYCMLHSGVHATITGVLLAFAIPFGKGDERSTSYILQHWLHKPVAFIILPVFAMANTGIVIGSDWVAALGQPGSFGIMAGLIIGKPLGILLFSFLGTVTGLCTLPPGLNWKRIAGAGFLGGIGFTMSIFITLLAFKDAAVIDHSRMAILVASFLAGCIGLVWLRVALKKK